MTRFVGNKTFTDHAHSINFARLESEGSAIAFYSSYHSALVAELKARVPANSRQWDNTARRWLVTPQYAQVCADLAAQYLGVNVAVPKVVAAPKTEVKLLCIEYLGRCKNRDNGESSAFGWANGSWSVLIPETVLREWFSAEPQRPNEMPTLYAVLSVKQGATFDEIRSNYRRLAKTWHPDLCHEQDAATTFRAIQHAYEVLSDDFQRRKYDAGLVFAARTKSMERAFRFDSIDPNGYRSPLRCGWVLAEGTVALGRFGVSKIVDWQDIVDGAGRTMIVSWPNGADKWEVAWS